MLYINTKTLEYPLTERQIKERFSNVSFNQVFVPPADYAPVGRTDKPTFDAITHECKETTPAFSDGKWAQAWIVEALPSDVVEENKKAHLSRLRAQIIAAAQVRLDSFAQTRGYDGILSACSYATSTVPKFKAEGQYCVEARDVTWAKLSDMLAEVEVGTRPVPSGFADIEPELPALQWPA